MSCLCVGRVVGGHMSSTPLPLSHSLLSLTLLIYYANDAFFPLCYPSRCLSRPLSHTLSTSLLSYQQGLPFFLTILPFFSDSYGDSGGWCWIKTTENEKWGNAWRFIQFFIPLWVSIAFNTYVYTKVHKQLSSMAAVDHNVADEENLAGDSSGENGGEKYSMLDRVKYYPMVLVACYFFGMFLSIVRC